jgi:hypothetical protein
MISLVADEAMLAVLRHANEVAEIRDSAGAIIGFFAPVSLEHAHLYAKAAAQINPQEIQRRKDKQGKYYTTQEVLDHLKSLESP